MKVKLFRGKAKPQYTLYLPADKRIEDLSTNAKQAVDAVGELTQLSEKDLTGKTDTFSKEVVAKLETDGAYFSKWEVKFDEVVGRDPE